MYFPAVMTHIVAIPLDEVFEAVVPYMAIQDLLNLVLLIAVDNSGWWGRVMLMTWNGVREHYKQLDH
jgi:hypothetical protein